MAEIRDPRTEPKKGDRWADEDGEWLIVKLMPDPNFRFEVTLQSKETGKEKAWFSGFFRRWCAGATYIGVEKL